MSRLFRNRNTDSFEAAGGDLNMAGSLAYIQLEKQNARLKEALIRYVIFSKHHSIMPSRFSQSS